MAIVVHGSVIHGVQGVEVNVEVDLLRRLPSISIVGLASHAIKESTERVRSAIVTSGFTFPRMRTVINLAPANVPKKGTGLDLPIAIGILACQNEIQFDHEQYIFAGELSLSGQLRPVTGSIAFAQLACRTRRTLVLPMESASIANLMPNVNVIGADTLSEVIHIISGKATKRAILSLPVVPRPNYPDLAEVCGQTLARRALEIAATGGHHLLFSGPPGCGKSMLAQRLPGILPEMSSEEALDCLRLRDLTAFETSKSLNSINRPFRSPHHTSSTAALIGDRNLRPGEITLAHHGVLFLDEAPEFSRTALEALREPIEDRTIRLCRAAGSVLYPASFILILASNPCPCGFRDTQKPCICTDSAVNRYQNKLSGPLLDRIDLHVSLQPTPPSLLFSMNTAESSQTVRGRVKKARKFRAHRKQSVLNAHLAPDALRKKYRPTTGTLKLLQESMDSLNLSARGAIRILRVARTIADLALHDEISTHHLTEAIGFRPIHL